MNYRIVNGAISYGSETILEEINFEIKEKEKMTDNNILTDYIKLSELEEQIKQIEDEINKKMEEWEELSNRYSELNK